MTKRMKTIAGVLLLATSLGSTFSGCKKDGNHHDNYSYNADSLLANSKCANPIPATLQPPPGNKLVLFTYGKGVQIYEVQRSNADSNQYIWVNTAPEATIFAKDDFTKKLANHFAGPTWEFVDGPLKGDKVVAARVQAFTKEASAIPWLLLKTVDSLSVNNKVSYVQRLCTEGGLAPKTGADEKHLGEKVRVPYTATYLFYEAKY